ncbi:DUF4097 family beta strand repeat-containing protein [Cellulosimicrobium arenosum]|uniref:DUF4097 family beta strand repeat protein n=1 Tax=Cellulosimicrobium arenosum TaxID=2708133 RepID=A0A927J2R0_9MICO|nr:DUF4097 family beta strand repeat-containing protein [Cellulosimicrobium arenosum]MBD8080700.1 DUF4097 family beta strand repeat protein [Cellulosimicrobium arenosum]
MNGESWTVDGPQIIDLERVGSLDATVLGGRVDVVAHDDPGRTDARVEVHAVDGRPLEVEYAGDALRIGHGPVSVGWRGFVERFRSYTGTDAAEIHVAVPAGTQVRVRTVTGEALVAGLHDGAYLATVSGALVASRTCGTLHVDTVSGDVAASEHDGRLEMESVSGALTATGALSELTVDSVSGTVTVATSTTPSVVRVNAVSADVLVRLPDPDLMDYAVRCLSGRVVVDGEAQHVSFGSFTRAAVHGPGRPVEVTAVSGGVTVLRGAHDGAVPAAPVDDGAVGR